MYTQRCVAKQPLTFFLCPYFDGGPTVGTGTELVDGGDPEAIGHILFEALDKGTLVNTVGGRGPALVTWGQQEKVY